MGALGVSVARQPTYAKPAEVAFDVNFNSVVSFGNAEPSGRIETPLTHRNAVGMLAFGLLVARHDHPWRAHSLVMCCSGQHL